MIPLATYLRRETRLSIAINSVLSLLFYAIFFPAFDGVALGWSDGLGFDFVPQSFAITLMSVLVPGFLTQKRLNAGGIAPLPGESALPRALGWRALLFAITAAAFGAIVGATLALVARGVVVQWGVGAAVKIAYGAVLAAIVTPAGVRATLHSHTAAPEGKQA